MKLILINVITVGPLTLYKGNVKGNFELTHINTTTFIHYNAVMVAKKTELFVTLCIKAASKMLFIYMNGLSS
jgi:hypothetical protein